MRSFLSLLVIISIWIEGYNSLANQRNEFCESILRPIKCNPMLKYRSIDGKCNNLQNPYFGAANTKLNRFIKSRYSDGISAPPKSVTGAELPSARLVSLEVFNDTSVQNLKYTHAFTQFGQFIAHDIANILKLPTQQGCCDENGKLVTNPDPNCYHIPVPESDENHSGMECLDFIRSITDRDMKCPDYPIAPAEQLNSATAAVDLSFLYGTNKEVLNRQRLFKDGLLAIEERQNSTWPRHEPNTNAVCFSNDPQETCYMSGDSRINQDPTLSVFTILFIREHNRIAKELKKLNPDLTDDELLFQEARRLNIATYQSIAYYGWFTAIVGIENVPSLGYYYQSSGTEYSTDYNPNINSNIYNEFPSGVFRLLHTTIEGFLRKLSETGSLEGVIRLSDHFHRPKVIEENGNYDSLIRGLLSQPAQFFDRNYHPEIRSYLFRLGKKYGSDLKAIDIQRGRDHGLGSYNELRSFCGLPKATKWEDFTDHIPVHDVENLRKVYAHVDDVDLNVGSSLEKPLTNDTMIGYTYSCLLKLQVKNLRSTDRFWFENDDPAARFTPNQLAELRKASLQRIICDNTEGIYTVPKNPFFVQSYKNNSYVKCSDIPKVDLSLFRI